MTSPAHKKKLVTCDSPNGAGQEMNKRKKGKGTWGNSLRALAISYTVCRSYLYRNISLVVLFF